MIIGAHFLLFSNDAAADRIFFRDVLGFPSVNAGENWLIFALPPAEAGIHPVEGAASHPDASHGILGSALYLMCDDLDALMASLASKHISCGEVQTARWGRVTTISLPSGGKIGLYQPSHPTALNLSSK
jgi:hypothetical protein